MNNQKVLEIIKNYKNNFELIHDKEIYKWRAIKHFQDNWDINAPNFQKMLENSLALTRNLLLSGQYFPRNMLLQLTSKEPDYVRELFKNLYKEKVVDDLKERITNFTNGINNLQDKYQIGEKGKNTYQDNRAILVYLTLRFPEKYYLYK